MHNSSICLKEKYSVLNKNSFQIVAGLTRVSVAGLTWGRIDWGRIDWGRIVLGTDRLETTCNTNYNVYMYVSL